ncbi:FRG domain-containing protein [Bradyrhizobium guangzhouense]|uniref:FRG domain-containing protein n=1 Tax=Bradyrhizobium guangzhouense TaxID=1325095 RepID=UPI0013E8DB75|nr:FRG domain-containing protein [Bradyrhizobium guangzhouense]
MIDEDGHRGRTETVHMESWEKFQAYVESLDNDPSRKVWDEVWFRGQGDAEWELHSTLERRTPKVRAVSTYLNLISEIKPAIESFTGTTFELPGRMEVEQTCREYDLFENWLRQSMTYLAHLRHCGFPSPLLDWSKSPYVAAYFAFARAEADSNVAIFAYRERANSTGLKIGGSDMPQIVSFGPIVKTHRRHFRQQSRYTACLRWGADQWFFEPHESVFGQKDNLQQDLLWKITIPGQERMKVLSYLDKFNLNEFTLFDSEESLLEMLATRVIDMRAGRS